MDSSVGNHGVVLVVLLVLYFVPYIVAIVRGKRNRVSILILNLFLGWTFVGWVVALVWAAAKEDRIVAASGPSAPR